MIDGMLLVRGTAIGILFAWLLAVSVRTLRGERGREPGPLPSEASRTERVSWAAPLGRLRQVVASGARSMLPREDVVARLRLLTSSISRRRWHLAAGSTESWTGDRRMDRKTELPALTESRRFGRRRPTDEQAYVAAVERILDKNEAALYGTPRGASHGSRT